jgi:hypothetical protein
MIDTVTISPDQTVSCRAANPWLIAATVSLAAFRASWKPPLLMSGLSASVPFAMVGKPLTGFR